MPFELVTLQHRKRVSAYWAEVRGLSSENALRGLANLLSQTQTQRVPPRLLVALCGSNNRNSRYRSFPMKKKSGGERIIDVPEPSLRWIQRSLLHVFSLIVQPHKCAHGFVPERSIISHAEIHVNRRWLFVTDIKEFFPSIHWGRVFAMLQQTPFNASADMARIIANLATYNGHLPQGAPTSPFLANSICWRMDHKLYRWAQGQRCRYSRYADDLAFSTDRAVFGQMDWQQLEDIVRSEGFEINEAKRRLVSRGFRQVLTGLVVNGRRPDVPREVGKNLRALLHNVIAHGWESQLHRGSLFAESESYHSYRSRTLPLTELRRVERKQSSEHLLINPAALSKRALDVPTFQKVVQGKLAYLAHIKGEDSLSFQSLQRLADQAFGRQQLIADELYRQQVYAATAVYRRFKRQVARVGTQLELKRLLDSQHQSDVLEFSWILSAVHLAPEPSLESQDLKLKKELVLATKYSALRSPLYTASFFRNFLPDGEFAMLLQCSNVAPPFSDLLARCRTLFRYQRTQLPNSLQATILSLLTKCRRLASIPSMAPLSHADEGLKAITLAFKRNIRFDEDRTTATDLIEMLERIREEIKAIPTFSGSRLVIDIQELRPLYSDVPAVQTGLQHLLRAALRSETSAEVTISSKVTDRVNSSFETYHLLIHQPRKPLLRESALEDLFADEHLRQALDHLRGYADWHLTVLEPTKDPISFDVMKNLRLPSPAHLSADDGLVHELIFYQYVP